MTSDRDVTFGNLAIARGLVSREAVQQAYAQLQAGQRLPEVLVGRGLLAPQAAAALDAELRDGSAAGPTAFATAAPPSGSGSDEARLPRESEVVHGRYQVLSTLGQGGMGAVYRARDGQRGVDVALKVMLPSADPSGNALLRFEREAKAVAKVDGHAGVVRVIDFGLHGLLPFAALDLVEGQDLKGLIAAQGALPLERALEVAEQVARAIEHCHQQGVLHRDLKPANVLVRGEDGRPFVTDFGLALETDDEERLTKTGEVLGTPAYMSPEQADGQKDAIDARTDVYALGAVAYEAATGEPPFQGGGLAVLKQVLIDLPPPPSSLREGLPTELDLILGKAMAKRQADRYPSAGALADDLAALRRGDPVTVKPPGRWEHFKWRWSRGDRRAYLQVAAAVVLAVALLFSPWVVYVWRQSQEQASTRRAMATFLDELPQRLKTEDPLRPRGGESKSLYQGLQELLSKARTLAGPQAPEVGDAFAHLRRLAAGELADDPLGQLLAEGPPERRAAFALAVRRVLTRRGQGWIAEGEQEGEHALLQAVTLLGWNAERAPEQVDVERARGLLQRAGRTELVARLASIDERVQRYLQRGVEATRQVLVAGGLPPDVWGAQAPLRAEAGALRWAFDAFLTPKRKQEAIRAAVEALEAAVKRLRPSRWKQAATYQAIRGWHARLLGFVAAQPRVSFQATWGELLVVVAKRARDANIEDDALVAFTQMLAAMEEQIDWGDREFKAAFVDLLFWRSQQSLQRGRPPPLDLVHLFPRMGLRPSSNGASLIKKYREQGVFRTFIAQHPTGDAYFMWAECVVIVSSRSKNENGELIAELWAKALGADLTPAEREGLKLEGERYRAALTRPLTRGWIPWARMRLASVVIRLALPRGRPHQNDLARCRAALGLLRGLASAPFLKRGDRLQYLDVRSEWLNIVYDAFARQGRAKEVAPLLDEAQRVGKQGLELASRLHERALSGKGSGQGSLIEIDIATDSEKVEGVWNSLVRTQQAVHQRRGDVDQALAVTDAMQAALRKRTNRINPTVEAGLLGVLVQGASRERWARGADAWEARARALLDYLQEHEPQVRRDLKRWRHHYEEARYRLAEFRYRRGDLDGALAQLEGARSIGGGRSAMWSPLLCHVLRRLCALDRRREAVALVAKMQGTATMHEAGWKATLQELKLGKVR